MYNMKFLEFQLPEDIYECQVISLESILGPQEGNIGNGYVKSGSMFDFASTHLHGHVKKKNYNT